LALLLCLIQYGIFLAPVALFSMSLPFYQCNEWPMMLKNALFSLSGTLVTSQQPIPWFGSLWLVDVVKFNVLCANSK
jgi:hypothetical protein